MKYAEFKKHLSQRLDMGESDLKSLLSANRKILKKLVNKDDGFSIPSLGIFKKHPAFKQKEYSHYHGYELITKLTKILRFYPESFIEKKIKTRALTHSDISDLLTENTGFPHMLSQRFLSETATIIKEGLERDSQIYVSGIGLFKIVQRTDSGTVKTLKDIDKKISFKADAGLRSNILKANEQALNQQIPGAAKAEKTKGKPEKNTHLISAFHHPIFGLSGSAAEKENIFRPDKQNRLNRETFYQENKDLYQQEKSSFFEWFVIAIFLIILAAGIFLLKPAVEPVNEFSSPPFEFSDIETPDNPKK